MSDFNKKNCNFFVLNLIKKITFIFRNHVVVLVDGAGKEGSEPPKNFDGMKCESFNGTAHDKNSESTKMDIVEETKIDSVQGSCCCCSG